MCPDRLQAVSQLVRLTAAAVTLEASVPLDRYLGTKLRCVDSKLDKNYYVVLMRLRVDSFGGNCQSKNNQLASLRC